MYICIYVHTCWLAYKTCMKPKLHINVAFKCLIFLNRKVYHYMPMCCVYTQHPQNCHKSIQIHVTIAQI